MSNFDDIFNAPQIQDAPTYQPEEAFDKEAWAEKNSPKEIAPTS